MSVHERAARDGARSETDERDMTARGREEATRARREAGNRGGKKRVKKEWVPQRERKERKLLCEEESSANEGSERSAPLRSARSDRRLPAQLARFSPRSLQARINGSIFFTRDPPRSLLRAVRGCRRDPLACSSRTMLLHARRDQCARCCFCPKQLAAVGMTIEWARMRLPRQVRPECRSAFRSDRACVRACERAISSRVSRHDFVVA